MWGKNLLLNIRSTLCKNQRGETLPDTGIRYIACVPPFCVEGVSSSAPHSYQEKPNETSLQDYEPQKTSEFQCQSQHLDMTTQLPSIYSGIGVGVYQGEAVVFLQMAIGETRWTVSKLRFEDLALFQTSIQSEISLLLCLLRLNNIQPDLVKSGLQTKDGIELMRSLCPLADNLSKLLRGEEDGDNPAIPKRRVRQRQQSRYPPICSECPICSTSYTAKSSTKRGRGQ